MHKVLFQETMSVDILVTPAVLVHRVKSCSDGIIKDEEISTGIAWQYNHNVDKTSD